MVVDTEAATAWIDDPNPLFRLGAATALRAAGWRVAGESAGLQPKPDFARTDVLVLNLGIGQLAGSDDSSGAYLLAIVPVSQPFRDIAAGNCTLLDRSHLTVKSLLSAVRIFEALPPDQSRRPARRPSRR